MNGLQIVMKAINPITLCMGFAGVCVGGAAASIHGYFEVLPFILCVAYAFLIQCTGNIGHRYYDEKFGYGGNIRDGIYNEDEDGHPTIYVLMEGVKVFYLLSITVGICIMLFAGWWTIIPGLLIMIINRLNNHGKRPWSLQVTYPLISFLLFGPVCVISTCMVIICAEGHGFPDWEDIKPAVMLSLSMGFMAMSSHIVHRASHSLIGGNVYTSILNKYGIKTAMTILTISTVAAAVLLAITPLTIKVIVVWGFLFIPGFYLIMGLYLIYQIYNRRKLDLVWSLSLASILFVGVSLFILFYFSGYPNFAQFDDSEIIKLL